MADLSNPTTRVLEVITLLSSRPMEDFSLADIAHQTGMSKASAHRILHTLVDADFLVRNAKRKTYSLGMGLLAAGQASLERHRGLDMAREEMAKLAADLSLQCSATALIGGDLVILARSGMPQSHDGLNRVGERRPMIPPMGLCHVAWGSESVTDPYLAFAKEHMSSDAYAWLLEALMLIRQRGYALAASTWRKLGNATLLSAWRDREGAHWETICALVGELTRDEVQVADLNDIDVRQIGQVAAPVFAADASIAFQLVLSGLPGSLTVRKLERCIERLLASTVSITNQINGCVPAMKAAQVR